MGGIDPTGHSRFGNAQPRAGVIVRNRGAGLWWRVAVFIAIGISLAVPAVAVTTVVVTLRRWARDLPNVPNLDSWRAHAKQTTRILAADGTPLAELPFRDGEVVGHRTHVALEKLPADLVRAVLAAEDVRFFTHRGVDYRAIARAAWLNYQAGRVVQGASTITQQVARNLLPAEIGTARHLRRKVREALLARAIDKRWTKRDVLETYLNFVFLGQGAYGMAAASRAYFDRDVGELDLAQSALLAGLIQAPGRLDPFHHLEAATLRRNEVLARMARAHLIDEPRRAAAAASPIVLQRPRQSRGAIAPWYTERVRRFIAAAFPDDTGGLVVETAALPGLGTELQRAAQQHARVWAQPASAPPRHSLSGAAHPGEVGNSRARDEVGAVAAEPQVGAILWDHRTGYVEALVGGREWNPATDQFDRMTQSCRQPGSTWKPIVYGAALDRGAITPGTPLRDAPIADYDAATNVHWKPRSSGRFRGVALAQDAFAASLNAPAIDVFERVGAEPVIALARKLGITTPLADVRPLALGASCVKPVELAQAFAIIARRGWAVVPRFVVRMRRGNAVVFDAAVPEDPALDQARRFDRFAATAGVDPAERVGASGGQLLDERVAFQLEDMMVAVVERGTASHARAELGRPAAGKTGTTNDNTDAWFIGFTGRVLGAVWVGFDQPTTKLGASGDGAHAALPLWLRAIHAAEGDSAKLDVPGPPPEGMERVAIDQETGLLAAPGTGGRGLWFRAGTAPTEVSGQPGISPTDFGRTSREF